MTEVVARSAKLGDVCVRDIPRLLSKEEIRDLSQIDSVKFTAAVVLEFALIALSVVVAETWFNPLTYVVEGIRGLLGGDSSLGSPWAGFAAACGLAIATTGLATVALKERLRRL